LVLKEPLAVSKEDLSPSIIKSLPVISFDNYDSVQNAIKEKMLEFKTKEPEEEIAKLVVEEKISKDDLISEISDPKPVPAIESKSKDNSPIDPNEKMVETNKRKLARANKNQGNLF